jgi:phosphatidylethanolamine/phosphatidyl-N-methylethanolamine N-methyltransferase
MRATETAEFHVPLDRLATHVPPATTLRGGFKDRLIFIKAWLADPLGVASAAPSSRELAAAITRDLGPQTGPVIELGPGTGAFTRALLQRGVRPDQLLLIEREPVFAELLRAAHPRVRVLTVNASQLRRIPSVQAGAVVSGLPLLWMPRPTVLRILHGAFSHLRPDGGFYQFTYMPTCPVPASLLWRLGLRARRVGARVYRNLPPAAVYRIERDGAHSRTLTEPDSQPSRGVPGRGNPEG